MIHSRFVPASALSPSFQTESELLIGLLGDEPAAWREFNDRYGRLIFRCITKVLGRFNGVVTQDDTREVYSALCVQLLARDKSKLRSYDAARGNKLSTWFGLLASNAAYDFLRSRRRAPKTEDLFAAETLCCDSIAADELYAQREQAAQIAELLKDLSDKDREFMTLYFGEGLGPDEVAELMGISVKTVYSKKHKIRARLEGMMERRSLAA